MSKSIVGIAKTQAQIENAVETLQESGVSASDLSVLIPDSGGTPETGTVKTTKAPEGATTGVISGGVAGGTLGLLAGIGALAIPGAGPFIAAGPIMAALSGAAIGASAGGVVGALIGMGIPELEAKVYEDRIKKGGYLLAVHINDSHEQAGIRQILKDLNFEDVSTVTEKK